MCSCSGLFWRGGWNGIRKISPSAVKVQVYSEFLFFYWLDNKWSCTRRTILISFYHVNMLIRINNVFSKCSWHDLLPRQIPVAPNQERIQDFRGACPHPFTPLKKKYFGLLSGSKIYRIQNVIKKFKSHNCSCTVSVCQLGFCFKWNVCSSFMKGRKELNCCSTVQVESGFQLSNSWIPKISVF